MDSLCVSSLRRSRKPKLSLNQPGCLYDTDTCYNGQKGEVFGNGGGEWGYPVLRTRLTLSHQRS